jgi:hypothetical protein
MIGSGIRIRTRIRFFQRSDPDPHQNDLDPQHCREGIVIQQDLYFESKCCCKAALEIHYQKIGTKLIAMGVRLLKG